MTRKRDANRGGPIDYAAFRPDSRVEHLRIPPQSIEAEMAVIGGLMLAPDAWPKIADKLSEADFYRRDHQLIYRAIAEMAEADPPKPYDAVTLGEWFEGQGLGEAVADGYLIELAANTPSAANITAYAEIVRDKAILRQLIEAGTGIVNDAFVPEGRDSAALIESAQASILALSMRSVAGGLGMVRGHARAMWDELVADNADETPIREFSPWRDVNDLIPRALPQEVIVIAARPSVGKTALALEIAEMHAESHGANVAVFSLEMSGKKLAQRRACARGLVDSRKLANPRELSQDDWSRIAAGVKELASMPIAIDDTPGITMREMRARALRMHQKVKGGLGLIVVDYLQLVETPEADNREQGIAAVSRGLKRLARELNIPIIALAQIGRESEKFARRPTLSDLRESGAIEQDADIVAFLHRHGRYVEFIVAKNRNGPTGIAKLSPELQFYRFKSYDPLDEPPEDDKPATRKRRGYGADTASARAGGDR
ncbi:MAG: replicative DNA helicase [Pseudomonadota bacterium]